MTYLSLLLHTIVLSVITNQSVKITTILSLLIKALVPVLSASTARLRGCGIIIHYALKQWPR